MQCVDEGPDIAGSLGHEDVFVGLGAFGGNPRKVRRQHDRLALQARPEDRVIADVPQRVAAEVEQDLAGVAIGDPAHDECRIREESPVARGAGRARDLATNGQRLAKESVAVEAPRPADRQVARAGIVRAGRDVGRALP